MGSTSSKFKKYLTNGDEFAAMQIYQSSPELRKNLDPNLSYGDSHLHNTPLHYASKHGMKHLLRTFLNDLNGNPNKKNGNNETALHCACQLGAHKTFSSQERRAACVTLLLQWRGVQIDGTNEKEKVEITAQDNNGNTALHTAAASGLERCVELLLNYGAPIFSENKDRLTPCDVAMEAEHHHIARFLESRMVFADNNDTINEDELYVGEEEEVYSGLRTQDLQEAKDLLSVETADMLNIPLFTAEALLRDNEWSRQALLEKWMQNPVECCEQAGVEAPVSAWQQFSGSSSELIFEGKSSEQVTPKVGQWQQPPHPFETAPTCSESENQQCDICLLFYSDDQIPPGTSCNHKFCHSCWSQYLTSKIQDGNAHSILCPAFNCHILIAPDFIDKILPAELTKKYLHFDIKAFVESNPTIKWCPMAGCGRAVRLPETEYFQLKQPKKTSHAVDCGNGHFFCWDCLGEAHAPSECSQWKRWQEKIAEIKPERLQTYCNESEDAANCLWLVTNSKPCPNCKSPIQKNEGCNHIKCYKCKHDFCWVCQESWKKHSSATGGYFRCNRFEAMSKAEEKQDVLITEAIVRSQQTMEQTMESNRFIHYYTRFRNHENSRHLEEPFLAAAQKKMATLAANFRNEIDASTTKFVEDAIRELLKARHVLCGSYVYGYYLEDTGYKKTIFELMQNELEEVTERLSGLVARPYLRTPRAAIVQTASLARQKRHEFTRAVSKGLIPPDISPPATHKRRKHRLVTVSSGLNVDELKESLRELKSKKSWLREMSGAHNDLTIYHFLEDSEEEGEQTSIDAVQKKCKWIGCQQVLSANHQSANFSDYCSLVCAQYDTNGSSLINNGRAKYNMDMMIAIEMSHLQMIEDQMKQKKLEQSAGNDDVSLNNKSAVVDNRETNDSQIVTGSTSCGENDKKLDNHLVAVYEKTAEDLTVDYFLKSLANTAVDIKNQSERKQNNGCHPDFSYPLSSVWPSKGNDKQSCSWKIPNLAEDGRFKIGDIHETGLYNDSEDFPDSFDPCILKRSHSTGDLIFRRGRLMINGDKESCYHLDSDHSSHDERPEDEVRRLLISSRAARHTHAVCGAQTSLEDTTTSDSFNADFEVCDILGTSLEEQAEKLKSSVTEDSLSQVSQLSSSSSVPRRLGTIGKISAVDINDQNLNQSDIACPPAASNPSKAEKTFSSFKQNQSLESNTSHTDSENIHNAFEDWIGTKNLYVHKSLKNKRQISLSTESISITVPEPRVHFYHKRDRSLKINTAKIKSVGKSTSSESEVVEKPHERDSITTEKSSRLANASASEKIVLQLGSNSVDYESETGIPKSPTLFISGVSISRTPEPKSPALSSGRQLRSSSLSVPPLSSPLSSTPLSSSAIFLDSSSCATSATARQKISDLSFGDTSLKLSAQQCDKKHRSSSPLTPSKSPKKYSEKKSKSANEPERDREKFHFMKSSTDGALSSVLHIQESNLSSDDFHEALFLLERSPKLADSKRSKKSKKNRQKDKENSTSAS
ncbi:unnamed protein product [Bemisia tabaci]|uniref:RBR-type E3 ubiquitin transferase n=1 Tax=Bemisia tabaci TaxID=7038 RepID=A0A9P0A954_BEMTA|nr:unnamed protein product [Bemisia tabaci]